MDSSDPKKQFKTPVNIHPEKSNGTTRQHSDSVDVASSEAFGSIAYAYTVDSDSATAKIGSFDKSELYVRQLTACRKFKLLEVHNDAFLIDFERFIL